MDMLNSCCTSLLHPYTQTTMSDILSLTTKQLRRAADLKEKIEALNTELASILGAQASTPARARKKRGMSAAGRAAVAAAQKARWAKIAEDRDLKKASQDNNKIRHKKPKRKMSAAAKARISVAAKERWAKVKAAGKKRL